MTTILGISAFFHDSAAALVIDGRPVMAAQEERFTRVKGDASFPTNAVAACLRGANLTPADVDLVAFYEKPLVKFERLMDTHRSFAPRGAHTFSSAVPLWANHRLDLPRHLRRSVGEGFRGEVRFADHHESHAASAFFPSPFEEAAVLTLDAVGEWSTTTLGHGRGNRVTLTHEMRFPHSVGMLYSAFTYYAGFKVNSGEYKLMGLAPYGQPRYVGLIREHVVDIRPDGSVWLDLSYFDYCHGTTMTSERFHELFGGPPREPEALLTQKEMDLAASIQRICEEIVLAAGRHLHQLTGSPYLAMAGGVALNCVANGRLLREGPFKDIWVQPAAGDAGGALGAALVMWHHLLGHTRTPQRPDGQQASLLGPSYDDADVGLYLDGAGATHHLLDEDELLDRVAHLLDDEKVGGWFQGRMEYGPRALGNRSIIGDPRSTQMQQTMNLKIKFRESFRPFAPCVLREHAPEVFEMDQDHDSPYMLFVWPIREELRTRLTADQTARMLDPDLRTRVSVPRSTLPAITHVDYSARVQTVDERHGRFYRLMRRFHELTGCPVVVNTSFNIRGEPIVCTPEDAYRCFMATDMDFLVIENHLLLKSEQDDVYAQDVESYRAQYALD